MHTLLSILLATSLTPPPQAADPALEVRGERAQLASCYSDSDCGGGACRSNKCTTSR